VGNSINPEDQTGWETLILERREIAKNNNDRKREITRMHSGLTVWFEGGGDRFNGPD